MPRAVRSSQFAQGLPFDVAASICGPIAAAAFAAENGRAPTLEETRALAAAYKLWTAENGMAGPAAQKRLMDLMDEKLGTNIRARLDEAPTPDRVAAEVRAGRPAQISTGLHYFYATEYDPATGRFRVGASGTDVRGGAEWMTWDEMHRVSQQRTGTGINGALYLGAQADQTTRQAGSERSPEPPIPRSTALPPVTESKMDLPGTVEPTMGEPESTWLFGHGRTMPDTGRRGTFATKAPEPTDADYERMLRQAVPGFGTVPDLLPDQTPRSYSLPTPRINGTGFVLPTPAEMMGVA